MRIPKGKLKKVAEKAEVPSTTMCDYAATRLRPSRKRSIHLEKTTGIPAALWLLGSSQEIKQAIVDAAEGV